MATIEQISQALPDVEANREFQNAVFQFKTGRLPTEADIADITQRAGSGKVKDFANIVLGKESPFAPPENLVSIPQGAAPIQADKLPVDTTDLSKILGANIDTSNLDPQVAGLLALFGKTTKDEEAVEALQTQFTDISKTLGDQGAELQKQLEEQGVPEAFNQVKELNLRGAQLVGELQQFDVETKRMDAGLENQPIPTGLITGQKAQLEKQRNLKRASIAADLAATSALSQAYAGNAALGQQLAQQAVDIKFQPILNELNVVKNQLGFATDKMTRNDSKRAGIINTLLDIRITELNDQKDLERDINLLAVDAASNGAPIDIVNAMKNATDLADATSIGQNFLGQAVLDKQSLKTNLDILAVEAARNGASADIINQMKEAGSLAEAAQIGNEFLKGDLESIINGAGVEDGIATTGFLNSTIESSIREDAVVLLDQVKIEAMTIDEAFTKLRTLYSPSEVTDEALRNLLGIVQPGEEAPVQVKEPQKVTFGRFGEAVKELPETLPRAFTSTVDSIFNFLFNK